MLALPTQASERPDMVHVGLLRRGRKTAGSRLGRNKRLAGSRSKVGLRIRTSDHSSRVVIVGRAKSSELQPLDRFGQRAGIKELPDYRQCIGKMQNCTVRHVERLDA
jgi:hypothetical protein